MLSVGAVSSNLNIVAKSTDYTATANDFVMVNATAGPVTITMPASPGKNTLVAVKKADASTNMVAIVPGTGALLNGDTAAGLVAGGASVTFQFDGVDWQMVSTGAVNAANTAAGIPTGGTSGQVLSKNSASNYDATWTTPAATAGPALYAWRSGRYYTQPGIYASQNASGTAFSLTAGPTYFFPVQVPNACTVASLSFYVFTSSGVVSQVGLYADNPTATSKGPGAQLANGTSSGSLQSLQTVPLSYTFAGPQTVWVSFYAASGNWPLAGFLPAGVVTNWSPAGPVVGSTLIPMYGMRTSANATPLADMSAVSTTTTTLVPVGVPFFWFQVV